MELPAGEKERSCCWGPVRVVSAMDKVSLGSWVTTAASMFYSGGLEAKAASSGLRPFWPGGKLRPVALEAHRQEGRGGGRDGG